MPLQEVQSKTTTSEFLTWMEYFEWDLHNPSKLDYYLAQIATEVRRSYVKNPRGVKLMILDFSSKVLRSKIERSKSFWMLAAPEGKKG